MRKIRELLNSEECVWIYLDSEAVCEEFYDAAFREGFGFDNMPREQWVPGSFVAVHAGGHMGHLSCFIWHMSFCGSEPPEGTPPRIDYRRWRDGEPDCFCRSSHLTPLR